MTIYSTLKILWHIIIINNISIFYHLIHMTIWYQWFRCDIVTKAVCIGPADEPLLKQSVIFFSLKIFTPSMPTSFFFFFFKNINALCTQLATSWLASSSVANILYQADMIFTYIPPRAMPLYWGTVTYMTLFTETRASFKSISNRKYSHLWSRSVTCCCTFGDMYWSLCWNLYFIYNINSKAQRLHYKILSRDFVYRKR